jgi:hypothetical protein
VLAIGYRSEPVAEVFRGSTWEAGWRSTISRATGATTGRSVRFTPAYSDKAVVIPLGILMAEAP